MDASMGDETIAQTERHWSTKALKKLNINLDVEPEHLLNIYIPYLIDRQFISL